VRTKENYCTERTWHQILWFKINFFVHGDSHCRKSNWKGKTKAKGLPKCTSVLVAVAGATKLEGVGMLYLRHMDREN
jgi:hypothetical protein